VAEPKPFASLSSGLLARKGAARPAMRPQGFGQVGGGIEEDLGWNDMGYESPKPAAVPRDGAHDAFGEEIDDQHPRVHPTGLTPVQSPVHDQQAQLADRLGVDPEDEEYDETAELYDPNAVDESEHAAEEDEAEEFEAEEPAAEQPAVETFEVRREKVQALPVRDQAEDEPFELTERFDDFDPFAETGEVEEPTPLETFVPAPPAPAYQPAPAYMSAPARQQAPRAAPGTKSKAAFTLRLDPDRHLKLRLACAVNGRSAQQIVTDAVDQLLRQMPELDAMAEKAKRKG